MNNNKKICCYLTVTFVIISSLISASCSRTPVPFAIETADLLPQEIALKYLNENTDCKFLDEGVIVKNGSIVKYDRAEYVAYSSLGWSVFVAPIGILGTFGDVQKSCALFVDGVYSSSPTDKEQIENFVTALASLGIAGAK